MQTYTVKFSFLFYLFIIKKWQPENFTISCSKTKTAPAESLKLFRTELFLLSKLCIFMQECETTFSVRFQTHSCLRSYSWVVYPKKKYPSGV